PRWKEQPPQYFLERASRPLSFPAGPQLRVANREQDEARQPARARQQAGVGRALESGPPGLASQVPPAPAADLPLPFALLISSKHRSHPESRGAAAPPAANLRAPSHSCRAGSKRFHARTKPRASPDSSRWSWFDPPAPSHASRVGDTSRPG